MKCQTSNVAPGGTERRYETLLKKKKRDKWLLRKNKGRKVYYMQ
jgi:hypothetical protein